MGAGSGKVFLPPISQNLPKIWLKPMKDMLVGKGGKARALALNEMPRYAQSAWRNCHDQVWFGRGDYPYDLHRSSAYLRIAIMSIKHPQTFTDADLSQMMARANKARAEELRKMFRQARAYIAGFFASHGAAATQN